MDKQLIKEYGEGILCYRIRTKRDKKRAQYEDFDKKLLGLYNEYETLFNIRKNLGWEPLTPPVQKGWIRYFVLREDLARSSDANFFRQILSRINTYDWSYRKDFLIKKRKFGRKIFVVKDQALKKPWSDDYKKMEFNEKEKLFFNAEYHYYKNTKEVFVRFVFNEPWRFVLQVRPNIIDKVKRRDEAVEARYKEVLDYFEKNSLWLRLDKMLYGHKPYRYKEPVDEWYMYAYKNKSINQVIDLIKEEEP